MSEEQPNTEEQQQPDTPTEAKNTEQPGPVPYDRFKQVNSELKALREQQAAYEKEKADRERAEKEAAEKRLAEQQKFEELAAQRQQERDEAQQSAEALKATVDKQTAVLQALYDARKSAVPEMYQPLLDQLDLTDRLQWIAENEEKLTPAKALNGIPATPPAKGRGEISDEERRRRAARTF